MSSSSAPDREFLYRVSLFAPQLSQSAAGDLYDSVAATQEAGERLEDLVVTDIAVEGPAIVVDVSANRPDAASYSDLVAFARQVVRDAAPELALTVQESVQVLYRSGAAAGPAAFGQGFPRGEVLGVLGSAGESAITTTPPRRAGAPVSPPPSLSPREYRDRLGGGGHGAGRG